MLASALRDFTCMRTSAGSVTQAVEPAMTLLCKDARVVTEAAVLKQEFATHSVKSIVTQMMMVCVSHVILPVDIALVLDLTTVYLVKAILHGLLRK